MTQKIIKIGKSAGITIPKKSLEDLGLKAGDKVSVQVNKKVGSVLIKPTSEISSRQKRIAELTYGFIERYRKDLDSLAQR